MERRDSQGLWWKELPSPAAQCKAAATVRPYSVLVRETLVNWLELLSYHLASVTPIQSPDGSPSHVPVKISRKTRPPGSSPIRNSTWHSCSETPSTSSQDHSSFPSLAKLTVSRHLVVLAEGPFVFFCENHLSSPFEIDNTQLNEITTAPKFGLVFVSCQRQGWGEVQAMVPRYRYLGVGQVQVQVHYFFKST